jgi:hypothetical protein
VGRAEEVCKGAAREIAARWARLSVQHCNPLMGHYPRTGAQDFINKIKLRTGFPARVFPGVFTRNLLCNVCLVSVFMLPLIF